jgi:tetratricopeptide (TPR) repeat protein
MGNRISVKGKLDFGVFLRSQFYSLRKRMPFFIVMAIFISLLEGYVILRTYLSSPEAALRELYSTGPWVILVYLIPLVLYVVTYFLSRKAFWEDRTIQKEQTYVFDQDGFQFSDDSSVINRVWKDISHFCETKHFFLIYVALQKGFLIPKSWMNTLDSEGLRALLNAQVVTKNRRFYKRPLFIKLSIAFLFLGTIMVYSWSDTKKGNESFYKGVTKEQHQDYRGALLDFGGAIQENPQFKEAYVHRGYCKQMLGNYTGYLEDCIKAITIDASYSEAYVGRAYAKYKLGDSLGACEDLHKADQLGYREGKALIKRYCK